MKKLEGEREIKAYVKKTNRYNQSKKRLLKRLHTSKIFKPLRLYSSIMWKIGHKQNKK